MTAPYHVAIVSLVMWCAWALPGFSHQLTQELCKVVCSWFSGRRYENTERQIFGQIKCPVRGRLPTWLQVALTVITMELLVKSTVGRSRGEGLFRDRECTSWCFFSMPPWQFGSRGIRFIILAKEMLSSEKCWEWSFVPWNLKDKKQGAPKLRWWRRFICTRDGSEKLQA